MRGRFMLGTCCVKEQERKTAECLEIREQKVRRREKALVSREKRLAVHACSIGMPTE